MSLSETMFRRGASKLIDAVHGETVRVLSGPDAGMDYTGVVEVSSDMVMTDTMADVRAKIMLRFSGVVPRLPREGIVQTANGKKWRATRAAQNGYLSDDFELTEIVAGKDL